MKMKQNKTKSMKTTSTTTWLLLRMFSAKAHFNIVEKSIDTIDFKNSPS